MSPVDSPPPSFIKPTMIPDVLLEGGEEEDEEEVETEERWRDRDLEPLVESVEATNFGSVPSRSMEDMLKNLEEFQELDALVPLSNGAKIVWRERGYTTIPCS